MSPTEVVEGKHERMWRGDGGGGGSSSFSKRSVRDMRSFESVDSWWGFKGDMQESQLYKVADIKWELIHLIVESAHVFYCRHVKAIPRLL